MDFRDDDFPTDADFDKECVNEARPSWIFVSHAAVDEGVVRKLLDTIAARRCLSLHIANRKQSDWVALAYKAKILENIRRCNWFIVAVSKAALSSRWVKFEVRCALRSKATNNMLCLVLDNSEPTALESGLSSVRKIDARPLLAVRGGLRTRVTRWRLASFLPKGYL